MKFRSGESGNIFFTLFGAIALVGVVGVATSTLMRGPVGTVLSLNQKAKIDSQLQIARKLAALEAAQEDPDCDGDIFIEPLAPDMTGACANLLGAGTGCLPAAVGAAKLDSWGTSIGYCGWNHGPIQNDAGCPDRFVGINNSNKTVLAVISAGPDRTFQATCGDDPAYVTAGGDDVVFEWTYDEASEGLGGGLWSLMSGDPDAITTTKDVEFASGTTARFDDVTAQFGAGSRLDLGMGGLFNLPNESVLQNGDCNGANKGVLRRFTNQPANDQEVLQICDGTNWQGVSGAGGTAAAGNNGEVQYNSGGTLDGDNALIWDAANNELGIGVNPNNTLDVAGTAEITGATTLGSTLGVGGLATLNSASVTTTLGVTGATSLSTLGTSGLATLNSASVTTTLGVTGATSLSTLGTSGLATLNSASVTTTLGVTGATTLGSTLGVTGATTLGSTLGVTGATSLSTLSTSGLATLNSAAVTNNATVGGTLGVTGAVDFDATLNVDGVMKLGANAQVEGGDCTGYAAGAVTFDGVNDELLLCSSVAGNKWVTVGTSGGGGGGAGATTVWERNGTVIRTKSPAVYATDDFVFGSTQLADTGDANNDARMFFDKSKGAFRAGVVDAAQWDDASVGGASAAFGNAIASGANSFAAGAGTTASGAYSTAFGGSSLASSSASFAAGSGVTSSGFGSIALGSTAKVLQDRSAVLGLGAAAGVYPQVNAVSSYGIFMGDQSAVSMNTANTMALLGGRMVIDPAVPATQTAVSGVLDLDVEGQIGAIQYCDETGANCFTAASVSGGTGAAPGDDREIVFNSADSLATDPNFVFTSAGRLGVGTATPVTTSHVVGNTLVTGTFGAGDMTPVSGAGTRMMFIPRKAAFRAGYALNTEWDDINIGNYSFASGYFVKALGTGAAAFGQDSAANANYSFVTGYDTDVSVTGTAGIAMGIDADVTGAFSMALGLGDAGAGTKPKVSGASSFGVFMGDQMNVDVSASNIMALLGGRLVIDPDTTSATNTNVSTGAQQLELDVAGDIGAVNYCDEAGNNCFTASSVGTADAYGADGVIQFASAGGLWGDANFVFTSAGRLGIGTAAPSYEMDVAGSAQVGGTLYLPAGGIPPNLSMAFAGDTDTGFYNAGDGTFYIVSNGTALLQVHGDKIKINSATAQIEAGFGTAANPTYSFDTDDNTGMYRAAADALGFSTAGTEKIRLVSGGALGIGDLTPDATLLVDVAGQVGATEYCDENGANCFTAASAAGGAAAYGADGVIQFASAGGLWGDANFVFTSAGRLGVGTAAPETFLHIKDTGNDDYYEAFTLEGDGEPVLNIRTSSAQSWFNPLMATYRSRGSRAAPSVVQSSDSLFEILATGYDGTNYERAAYIHVVSDGTPGNNDMPGRIEFHTQPDGSNGILEGSTPELVIKNDGKIGISTGSPGHLLSVASDVENGMGLKVSNANGWENSYIMAERSRGTNAAPTVVASGDVIHEMLFNAYDGTNYEEAAYIGVYVDGTPGNDDMPGRIEFNTQPDGAAAWLGDGATTPEMVIKNNGAVGIGTAAPADKLHIYSTANAAGTGLTVDNQGASNAQQSWVNLMTLGDGTKQLPDAATKGWSMFGRGNAYATVAERNDLGFAYWNGAGWISPLWMDSATGSVGIGTSSPASVLVVAPPAAETVAAAAVVTANACGTIKQITAGGNVTTNTTDTFTAPTASYAGCCMDVINVDAADTITLDQNAKFFTGDGSDVALAPGKSVRVCSDGTSWYQAAAVSSVASSGSSIDGLSDAYTDYTTLNNIIMGRAGAAALTAGAQYNVFIGENAGATTANSTAGTDMNVALGHYALPALTSGNNNTALGPFTLQANTTGGGNVALGSKALNSNVGRQESTALGYSAMEFANSAAANGVTFNTAVGAYALQGSAAPASNTGTGNTAIGHESMQDTTSGTANVGVGYASLHNNATGHYNIAVGYQALNNQTAGDGNTAVGYGALLSNATKQQSTAIGYNAMLYADSAAGGAITYNTALGAYALQGSATAASNTGTANTAIGHSALMATTSGYGNTAVGELSLKSNTTGYDNAALGTNTLNDNTTGYGNTALGDIALYYNKAKRESTAVGYYAMHYADSTTTGAVTYNTAVGAHALKGSGVPANNTGTNNTALGHSALTAITSGGSNVAVGALAGDSLTTGGSNILIGYDIDTPANNTSNHLNIGNTIYGDLSTDYVGIGIAVPTGKLHIKSTGGAGTSQDMLKIETEGEPFFTIRSADNSGLSNYMNPLMATYKSRGTLAAPAIVQSGDTGFELYATGYDGNTDEHLALISVLVDGTPGDEDMPGRIEFHTSPDGNGATLEGTTPEMVIKNNGYVGIGTATPGTILDIYGTNATARILSNGEGGFTASAASANWWDNAGLTTSRSRGTIAAPSVVQSGDSTMTIWSTAYDGNTWETPALIQFFVDGTPGDGDMPGRIEFQTQADGAAVNPESTTPEMVIKNNGAVGIGLASPSYRLHVENNAAAFAPQIAVSNLDASANAFAQIGYIGNARTYSTGVGNSTASGYDVANKWYLYDLTADAMRIVVTTAGRVGISNTSPDATFEVTGGLCVSDAAGDNCTTAAGAINADAAITANAFDLAERYPSAQSIEPGTIVSLEGKKTLYVDSAMRGAGQVLGIVSTDPGLVLGWENNQVFHDAPHVALITLSGRVPLKVNGEGGTIHIGDRLTLSSVTGTGMKAGRDAEMTVGIALEEYDPAKANGAPAKIMTFVQLRDQSGEKQLWEENAALRQQLADLKASMEQDRAALDELRRDVNGLKAYTGYGIGKAQAGFMMIGAAGGAALLVIAGGAVMRRRRGEKNT